MRTVGLVGVLRPGSETEVVASGQLSQLFIHTGKFRNHHQQFRSRIANSVIK